MKKIIASLLAVLLVSSTISPAVAANIADVKSSIAFSKIENYVTSASSLDTITSNLTAADVELEATIDQILQIDKNVSADEINPGISLTPETLNSSPFTLLEVYEDEDEKIVTYQIYNKRVSLHFYKDRDDISKSVTIFNSDGTLSFENTYNDELRSSVDSFSIYPITGKTDDVEDLEAGTESLASKANTVVVDPHEFDFKTNSYVAKFEGAKSFTFPALKDLGLDYTQTVKLYSSAMGFEEVKSGTVEKFFEAKSHLDLLATFWNIGPSVAKGFLEAANVFLNLASEITKQVTAIREHEYVFSGGLESTVYDPTYEHTDVEVLNEWDQGIYTLGWDAGFGEFENAEWKVTAIPFPWETSESEALPRSANLYNAHIANNGRWLLGVGRLGY